MLLITCTRQSVPGMERSFHKWCGVFTPGPDGTSYDDDATAMCLRQCRILAFLTLMWLVANKESDY
jgi:hypothetical protein